MIIVSVTSPITALLTIGEIELLSQLFGQVIIPVAVHKELLRTHSTLPQWMRIETVTNLGNALAFGKEVDSGEAEAIELAIELRADRLLIDDAKGRRLAERQGLKIIGLLGVIILAKTKGLIPSARLVINRLEDEADVYLSADIRESALRAVGE